MTEPRIDRLRSVLRTRGLDAIIVSALPHVRYLTKFSGSHALCLVRLRSTSLYTDTRYAHQCTSEARGIRCKVTTLPLIEEMAKELKSLRSPRVAIQEDYLDVATYRRLKTLAPAVHVVLSKGLVERLVEAKEPAEIRSIRAAAQISGQAFEHVLRQIRPGTTELEISAEISFLHKRLGGEADAFEPIVASGRRSSFPHARATSRKISHGDVVLLDFGCVVNGYRSDITRTVFVGKATSRMRRVYSSVLEAHHMAIEQACPFMRAKDLDAVARQHLRQAGIARHFVHSLGHGLGLQVHEGPRISPKSTDILRPGNVVTIEPGVYIPTLGGIRIEDDILITNSGSELLSHANTDLLIL